MAAVIPRPCCIGIGRREAARLSLQFQPEVILADFAGMVGVDHAVGDNEIFLWETFLRHEGAVQQ